MNTNPEMLYQLFSRLLSYPTVAIAQQARECANILSIAVPEAGEMMAGFIDQVGKMPLSDLQEIYTYTFDLQGTCPPYVGHQLFGESYKRSWFMARLNGEYEHKHFTAGSELPDHAAVILEFLAGNHADEFDLVLQNEGLKPAVERMLNLFIESDGNPYRQVLRALSNALGEPDLLALANQVEVENGGVENG